MDDKLIIFVGQFRDYINGPLKNSLEFKESYKISINGNQKIFTSNSNISQLFMILNIEKYKNDFINAIVPALSKIFPNAKKYGIYINTNKIQIKQANYFDIIPRELLLNILLYLSTVEIENYILI